MPPIPFQSPNLRLAAGYVGLFVSFVLGAELGHTLSINTPFATFWPPAGVYLAALLLAGRRRDPLTVAVAVAANLATNCLLHGRSLPVGLGFCAANTAQALLAAAILRRFGVPFALDRVRNVAVLALVAGVIGPVVGATIGSTLVACTSDRSFASTWIIWATSNGLGSFLFLPPILTAFQPGQWSGLRRASPWRIAEFGLALSLLAAASYYIFGVLPRPLPLVVLPPLLWVAVRFDVRGVPFSNLILATMAIGYAHVGRGPFWDRPSLYEQVVFAQGAMSVISLSFLTMAGLVAERRRAGEILAESEMRFRLLVQETTDYAICMLDAEGNVATWNSGADRITGWDEVEIAGRSAACFSGGGEQADVALRQALAVARETGRFADEGWRFNKAGSPFWARVAISAIYDGLSSGCPSADGGRALRGFSYILRDRTETRLREVELETTRALLEEATSKFRSMAHTDPLTQLQNRRGFFDEFDAELARSVAHAVPFSLLLFDVDHFKPFNDTFGHSAGDEVLKQVGALLAANVRGTDIVGRYGGEEFVVLLPATDAAGAVDVAERVREAVETAPWPQRSITVSVGVATLDPAAENGLRLIEEADLSLYASKAGGRNRSTHFLELADRELAVV